MDTRRWTMMNPKAFGERDKLYKPLPETSKPKMRFWVQGPALFGPPQKIQIPQHPHYDPMEWASAKVPASLS